MSEAINYCWFDCDPGIDDAFAILLASHAKNIKIIGMSTVSGNHHIDYVTENAFKLMNLYGMIRENGLEFQNFSNEVKLKECEILGGMKFPLIKGNARPLLKKQLILADEVHGEDGLGSSCKVDYPAIPRNARVYFEMLNKQRVHFTTHIYRALFDSQPNKITIIATGPLTNIALLLINHPDSKNYIEKIVMMGGLFFFKKFIFHII
jgi:pyrimidine-specific ribonucleoside hydrolase